MRARALPLVAVFLVFGWVPAQTQGGSDANVETFATLDSPGDTENIFQRTDGSIFVTGMVDRVVWKISPRGVAQKFALVPQVAMVIGVAPNDDGVVITASERTWRRPGQTPAIDFSDVGPEVLVIDKTGKVVVTVPGQKGQFFNGVAQAGNGKYLIADTQVAAVWQFDLAKRQLAPWLQDDQLAGANGIKVHDNWVYVSTRAGLQRIQIEDGHARGKPIMFAKDAHPDDFGIAKDGSVYYPSGTTLFKVSQTGEISKLRENIHGGAAAWVSQDAKWVYWPTKGGTEPQKVLRVPIS